MIIAIEIEDLTNNETDIFNEPYKYHCNYPECENHCKNAQEIISYTSEE